MYLDVVLLDERVDDLEGRKEALPKHLLEALLLLVLFMLTRQFKVVVLVPLLLVDVDLVFIVLLWL